VDETRSDETFEVSVIDTPKGPWVRRVHREKGVWSGESGCPVQTEADHEMLVLICEQIGDREQEVRLYFRQWRQRVGEEGVIVLGHPHPSWLGYQISPERIFAHWQDHQAVFRRSMDAIYEAALFVMDLATEEGIDFMSDSSYGLEMTSPAFFEAMDLPYIRAFADWTHERGGLFWYHNCGLTRRLILGGTFNRLGADVIETLSPPPEGDNDLAESRPYIDAEICTKGNLSLPLLRDGAVEQVVQETLEMVEATRGHAHIFSTADAVLFGTPPENLVAFVKTVREAAGSTQHRQSEERTQRLCKH
jgi:hypothetical protein